MSATGGKSYVCFEKKASPRRRLIVRNSKNPKRYCRVSKPRPGTVVVHNIDRWARNGQDHDMMRAFLIKLGVKLRSYSQRLGETPYDQFYERIM